MSILQNEWQHRLAVGIHHWLMILQLDHDSKSKNYNQYYHDLTSKNSHWVC